VRYEGGRECGCGNLGCAEAESSVAFLAEWARTRSDFAGSPLAREPLLDFAAIFKHAGNGDACAIALRDHSVHVWATLVVNLIHLCDPEMVILGGGVMASADVILSALRPYVARHAHTRWGSVQVAASQLGDRAALVAGEWLIREQFPDVEP